MCKVGEQTFQSYFFQVGNLMVQQKIHIGTLLFVSIIAILKFMAISNVDDNSTQAFKYSDYQKVLDKKQVIIFSPSSWWFLTCQNVLEIVCWETFRQVNWSQNRFFIHNWSIYCIINSTDNSVISTFYKWNYFTFLYVLDYGLLNFQLK